MHLPVKGEYELLILCRTLIETTQGANSRVPSLCEATITLTHTKPKHQLYMMEKSAVAEHAWEHHHPIHLEETTILDHDRGQELLVKEALHIQMTPVEERFNRDGGLEVSGCWTAVMRRQAGRSNPHRPLTSNDVYPR